MSSAALARLAVLGLAALCSGGCASEVDTLLGLDATIEGASVEVMAGSSGDVVRAAIDVDYRAGAYTEMEREFGPQAISIFAGGAPVAQITPELPPDFTQRLAPGESASARLEGETREATDPRRLCGGEATILFRWIDRVTSEIGMVEATTNDVSCD